MTDKELVKLLDSVAKRRGRRIVTGKARGGKRSEIITVGKQGKYLKYRIPPDPDKVEDIALLPTIRAAIMHAKNGKVEVRKRDFREKVRRRKISTLLCIVMDSSSSMAESDKIAALRSALDTLFLDAYQKRDRVALITVHGHKAEVLSKFTSGVDVVKKMADRVKFGGTTPLSMGISRGIEIIKSKISTEPSTVPIMIVVTDGMPNTPSVTGGDVFQEIRNLGEKAKDTGIRTVVIDVDPEMKGQALADMMDASYYHATGTMSEMEFKNPAYTEEIEKALYLQMVNPELKGFVFRNFPEDAIDEALERIRNAGIEIDTTGCMHHCDPDRPEDMCRECYLKNELGILKRKKEPMPIVVVDKDVSPEELKGEIYLRYLLTPSMFREANRGLLFIKDVDLLSEESARVIADVLISGVNRVEKDGYVIEQKVRFSLAGSSSGDVPEVLREFFISTIDAEELDEFEMKVRSSLYQNEFDTDPRGFEERMAERERMLAERAKKARDIVKSVVIPEEYAEIMDDDLKELAKSIAAMSSRLEVDVDDVVEAMRLASYDIEGVEAESAYGDVIADSMRIPLVNPDIGVLFRNFPEYAIDEALERIRNAGIEIESTGCMYHCDPDRPEDMCRECYLKNELGILKRKKEPMPIVVVDKDVRPEELKGEIYLRYLLTPSVFRDVNRGLLFIKDVDLLSEESARVIADVLISGVNRVEKDGYVVEQKVRFSLAGSSNGNVPEVLREFFISTIDAEDLDEFEMKVRSALPSARRNMAGEIKRAREVLNETYPLDSQLDSIARVCYEMNFEGNSSELRIVEYARTLAAIDGERVPENRHILAGIKALRWRIKDHEENEQEKSVSGEEVMANG